MMWAVFVKEIRENAGRALLGALVLCCILGGTMYSGQAGRQSITSDTMLMTSIWSFCGAGLALGVAQVLQDTRRGRWGFVIHRPISRWRVFAAKALAGILLYAIASSAAMFVLIVLAREPRIAMAPFSWEMTIPILFAQACGVLAYAAGTLVAARRAAWLGSRIFPAAAGFVIAGGAAVSIIDFTPALLVVLGGAILLAISAAAYFVHNGEYEPQSAWFKPLHTLAVAAGVGCLMVAVIGISFAVIAQFAGLPPRVYYGNSYSISRDGKAQRVEYGGSESKYFDLDGNLLKLKTPEQHPMSTTSGSLRDVANTSRSERLWYQSFLRSSKYTWIISADNDAMSTTWYYVSARSTIEGYNRLGAFVGTLGPKGFAPPEQPAEPFGDDPLPDSYHGDFYRARVFSTRYAAYWLDTGNRQLRELFRTTPDEPLLSAGYFTDREPQPHGHETWNPDELRDLEQGTQPIYFTFMTRSKLHVMERSKPLFTRDLDFKGGAWMLSIGRALDGTFCLLYSNYSDSAEARHELIRVDAAGQTVEQTPLPPLPQAKMERRWTDELPIVFVPPAIIAYAIVAEGLYRSPVSTPYAIGVACMTVLGVAATIWLCRRYSVSRAQTICWLVFAILAGAGAAITFWFVHDRPIRVPCPACGKGRNIKHERCEYCDAPFPKPSMPEIEVFETARPLSAPVEQLA